VDAATPKDPNSSWKELLWRVMRLSSFFGSQYLAVPLDTRKLRAFREKSPIALR
jgi:hypothetical protein